jgi:hypothetical protein
MWYFFLTEIIGKGKIRDLGIQGFGDLGIEGILFLLIY